MTENTAMAIVRKAKLVEKYSAGAKERQKRKPVKSVRELVPEPISEGGRTSDQLGKLVGVSGKTVDNAKKVLAKGT